MYSPVVWVTWDTDVVIRTAAIASFEYNRGNKTLWGFNGDSGWCLASKLTDDEGRRLIDKINEHAPLNVGWFIGGREGTSGGKNVVDINAELEQIRNEQ